MSLPIIFAGNFSLNAVNRLKNKVHAVELFLFTFARFTGNQPPISEGMTLMKNKSRDYETVRL